MPFLPFGRAASAAACAVLLAAAPASAQAGRCSPSDDLLRGESPAEADRRRLIDVVTNTLYQAFVSAAREEGIEAPAGLALVELTSRRRVSSVRVVRGNVPEALLRAVAEANGPLLSQLPRGVSLFHVRLDPREFPEGAAIECHPALLNPQEFEIVVRRLSPETLQALSESRRPAVLRMLVTRDGDVAHAYFSRISSAARMDMDFVSMAYRLRFDPATVAGVPIDLWVEQPINVTGGR